MNIILEARRKLPGLYSFMEHYDISTWKTTLVGRNLFRLFLLYLHRNFMKSMTCITNRCRTDQGVE